MSYLSDAFRPICKLIREFITAAKRAREQEQIKRDIDVLKSVQIVSVHGEDVEEEQHIGRCIP